MTIDYQQEKGFEAGTLFKTRIINSQSTTINHHFLQLFQLVIRPFHKVGQNGSGIVRLNVWVGGFIGWGR